MKKLLATLLFAFFIFTVSNISLLAFSNGNGTVGNPYQITTKQHLELLADSVNNGYNWSKNKYFKLMNNITLPVTKMIGLFAPEKSFQGNFDGQNNTITLDINGTGLNNSVGLFSCLYTGSIENVIVTGSINVMNPSAYVGGIVGSIVTGFTTDYTGNKKIIRISNCVNSADLTITTNGIIGGIVGSVGVTSQQIVENEVIIENCINIGSVKGQEVGGILGICGINIAGECIVRNCINYGLIVGDDTGGGIAGIIENTTIITNCFNSGVVEKNTTNVGCIVGTNNGGTVTNCHYDMQMCKEE